MMDPNSLLEQIQRVLDNTESADDKIKQIEKIMENWDPYTNWGDDR